MNRDTHILIDRHIAEIGLFKLLIHNFDRLTTTTTNKEIYIIIKKQEGLIWNLPVTEIT